MSYVQCIMEVEGTDAPTQAGKRIERLSKPEPDSDLDNDAPGVFDGEPEVLQFKNMLAYL